MRRSQVLGSAVALLLLAGAGVALTDGDSARPTGRNSTSSLGSGEAQSYADDAYAAAPQLSRDAAGGGSTVKEALAAPAGPRIVKTASLTVSLGDADKVVGAAREANSIAERHGGFVASTDSRAGEYASSELTLRVPVAAYDAALQELRKLGEVSNESLGGQDVTGTLVDLDARLRSLRAQETALNGLLAKATTVGETLQVAQAVADVRTQIEQLAAQQKTLNDQADFATITLSVTGPSGVTEPKPDPVLVRAIERATGGALDVLGGAIVVVGYALPASVFAAVGYALVRLYRRRATPVAAG